jgi:tetratricopeptide (TPR) repeat protein
VLAVPQPNAENDYLVDRAMWHFTRGLSYCAKKDATAAADEHAKMSKLVYAEDAKKLNSPVFPATSMLAVAEQWLAGKVAEAKGDSAGAIESLKKAVKSEDELPYMEPGYWPIPTRPALGAVLMRSGKSAEAEEVFRDDVHRWPRNGWGLFGLEQSLRAQGKGDAADIVHREFADAWKRADVKLDLAWY